MNISFGQAYLIKSNDSQVLKEIKGRSADLPGKKYLMDNKLLYVPRNDDSVMDDIVKTLTDCTTTTGSAKEWESIKSNYKNQILTSMAKNAVKIDLDA